MEGRRWTQEHPTDGDRELPDQCSETSEEDPPDLSDPIYDELRGVDPFVAQIERALIERLQ